jgi:hypothetical protein
MHLPVAAVRALACFEQSRYTYPRSREILIYAEERRSLDASIPT